LLGIALSPDVALQANTPYLAFVATKDMRPGTEITFDYKGTSWPDSDVHMNQKGKGKDRAPDEPRLRCNCGALNCRKYVY
jgi:SET domain-containing protein